MKHEHEYILWEEIREHPYFFTILTITLIAFGTLLTLSLIHI